MPTYNARGQAAASRRATKNKVRIKAGQGRISHALGKNDPRNHRSPQGAQATERQYNTDQFSVDSNGRITLKEQ